MQPNPSERDPYNGLTTLQPTLPSTAYWDADAYRHDLGAIWYRSWLMVCRETDLAEPLAFRTFRIGSQEVVVLRDETGSLRAFHNTCRHRGSQLCQESAGLLTCPYHAWSYSLRGDLVRVPSKSLPEGFDKADYQLYRVALSVWRGFVFVNLAEDASGSAESAFDRASGDLSNWPLETLVTGHLLTKVMNCNWKIFWENFNECLHCPGVHKDLSRLVPIYGRGLMARHDDPEWTHHADNDAPEFSGRLRAGAETWSRDGHVHGPVFPGLTPTERAAGQTYATSLPSMFIVGHVDYMRTVRLVPLGPEQTELTAEWLFAPDALGKTDIDNIVAFGTQVLEEDAAICEVNQKGLRSMRHEAGVLMPEEYDLHRFHDWVRGRQPHMNPNQNDFGR
ncbi:aromatic ring-hydroxylating dioxygenase subunit alpha [Mesorhizobium hawassense]|uniref:Aromatic ring-hydroxylating dioxygenase subunit alpha n=1 Tax=Mesorhizobium hawassense TaxID=1209954 RepID=A0A330HNK9_9HYPH|nr:aromatic ring-hydroxylating dioxygenase subunit alpha [Mesorhizobium hawassense]RAZ89298.1 aromatic ring-hydroxylating dioxygenase subunit alpha [Mesorhizobium hawassense]